LTIVLAYNNLGVTNFWNKIFVGLEQHIVEKNAKENKFTQEIEEANGMKSRLEIENKEYVRMIEEKDQERV